MSKQTITPKQVAVTPYLYPTDIFEAVEHAKNTLKDRTKALRIDLSQKRVGKKGSFFATLEILKKYGTEWKYVPLKIKFSNLTNDVGILAPDHPKREYPGVSLKVQSKASYVKDGIEQRYYDAKVLINEIYHAYIKNMLDSGVSLPSTKICSSVQTLKTSKTDSFKKEKLPEAIVRLEIKFYDSKNLKDDDKKSSGKDADDDKKKIDNKATPSCNIFDIRKPIKKGHKEYREGVQSFEKLTYTEGDKQFPLMYENIWKVIGKGSIMSGVDDSSTVSITNLGISLSSKIGMLLINPKTSSGLDVEDVFDTSEIEGMEVKSDDVETTGENGKSEVIEKKIKSLGAELDDLDLDEEADLNQ